MPIQSTIANQLMGGAVAAAAEVSSTLPDHCSPAIREAAQIHAAIAHVAGELYGVPEGAFRQRVLLALAQESAMATVDAQEPPELGICEWFAGCGHPATHLEPHPILGQVPACDRCPQIGR